MSKADAYAHVDRVRSTAPHGYLLSGTGSGTWNSRIDYRTWTDPWKPTEQFALHYNGGTPTANDGSVVRAAEAFHIDFRGFRGIAYDWLVDGAGIVYEGRAFNESGAQFGEVNDFTDGVQLTVGASQPPTDRQWEGFEWLRREVLLPVFGNRRLVGHKETDPVNNPTECPGPVIFAYVETHRFMEDDMAFTPEEEAQLRRLLTTFSMATASGIQDLTAAQVLEQSLKECVNNRGQNGYFQIGQGWADAIEGKPGSGGAVDAQAREDIAVLRTAYNKHNHGFTDPNDVPA